MGQSLVTSQQFAMVTMDVSSLLDMSHKMILNESDFLFSENVIGRHFFGIQ